MHKSGWDRQWWCADLGLFPSRPQARDGLLHCDYLVARKKKMEKIKDVRPNRKEVAERDENNSIFSFRFSVNTQVDYAAAGPEPAHV